MKQFILAVLVAPLLMTACKNEGTFKKNSKGTLYKITSDGKGDTIKYGSFIELSFTQKYKDSVMMNTEDGMNMLSPFDSASIPPDVFEIFKGVRKGDSITMKFSVDSIKKNGGQIPPHFKNGEFIVAGYRIVNVYATKEQADSAYKLLSEAAQKKAEKKAVEQVSKDDKIIQDYLAKNKITAVKSPNGTYVQIINPGTGNKIDTNVQVMVNYTGKNLDAKTLTDGKTFDSNTDPAFKHVQPIPVQMWQQGGMILGWTDALPMLSKGAKARFFIPSGQGYGAQGRQPDIGPFQVLMFDIEVLDLLSKDVAMAEAKKQQEMMMKQQQAQMAMQKRYEDSVNRAAKVDTMKMKK